MKLKNRFLLLGMWIILFCLATPGIILFALGYKFDFESKQIVKTGTVVVRSLPKSADIYIDDELQRTQTDTTLRFIVPGDYNIQISKDEYQSWTKRLNVRSALATWAAQGREFITLFYSQPKLALTQSFAQAFVIPQNGTAIIVDSDEYKIVSANKRSLENIDLNNASLVAPNNLDAKSTYHFLRYQPARAFAETDIATTEQLESNEQYAALLSAGRLIASVNGSHVLVAENVSGFLLENDHIWYTQTGQLLRVSLITNETEMITQLPYAPIKSQIIRGESQIFMILDQTAYALNDRLEEIYRGATTAYWDGQSQRLVISNNNEAILFDPHSFRSELVIRSSTTIKNVITNAITGYLFFINEEKVKAIELDGRDHRNVYTISNRNPDSFILDGDGQYMTIFTDSEFRTLEIR